MLSSTECAIGFNLTGISGPPPIPHEVGLAMMRQPVDHRGSEFKGVVRKVLDGFRAIFDMHPVLMFPGTGTAGLEASLLNLFAPGDSVLFVETGYFSKAWASLAERLGLEVLRIESDSRHGADGDRVEAALRSDVCRHIKAVCVCHNETSTGVLSDLEEVRLAIDAAGHPALLLVDAISSLGVAGLNVNEWGIDVAVGGSQEGLMVPPGLSFNFVSQKAWAVAAKNPLRTGYWSWDAVRASHEEGMFPYTPPIQLLFGLSAAFDMISAEGLDNVLKRHAIHAEAVRRAFARMGLNLMCLDRRSYSPSVTGVVLPESGQAQAVLRLAREADLFLAPGLGRFAGEGFRLSHLGRWNELMVLASIAGLELILSRAAVPYMPGGVGAAIRVYGKSDEEHHVSPGSSLA
jgi:alanine-glyoxylate transaminase/serine-glyoxylate transaminase/serine-pyruvate transaminase